MKAQELPVVAIWIELALEAIRANPDGALDAPQQLHIISAAIYDAWAAFDPEVSGYHSDICTNLQNTQEHKAEAVSFAAFVVLRELYPDATAELTEFLSGLGYKAKAAEASNRTPAGIGTTAAHRVLDVCEFQSKEAVSAPLGTSASCSFDHTTHLGDGAEQTLT